MSSVFEIDLFVSGPITINRQRLRLNEAKGMSLEDPFYSDIEIAKRGKMGVEAMVTAMASSSDLARHAAMYFFSQMLDVLALRIKLPMEVYQVENDRREIRFMRQFPDRQVIDRAMWHKAFQDARLLAFEQSQFLTALGWYRKGLNSENPIDRFLAFWNAIERVAKAYHTEDERTKKGVKNQVWQCFVTVWGDCQAWPVISGQQGWIDENYDIRNAIAHGGRIINVVDVQRIVDKLETIKQVAGKFLTDWYEKELDTEPSPAFRELYHLHPDRHRQNIR